MEPELTVQLADHALSVVGQDLSTVPAWLQQKYGAQVTSLDLSYNNIATLDALDGFAALTSLVVDNNRLVAQQDKLPRLDALTTLCVNDNDIANLEQWLSCVAAAFPNLTYLSMLKNPACPNYFTGKDQQDYARYRLYVVHRLPALKFLDSSPVTAQERAEAKRVGHLMRVARPADTATAGQAVKSAEGLLVAPAGEPAQQPQQGAQGQGNGDDDDDDDDDADDVALPAPGRGKASFGVSRYYYQGKQSEGNRFITNEEL